MREVFFFVQRRITASILACGWRLHSLNSALLKAADVCLDPNFAFHHSLLHFSAANNISQTPAPFQHHRRGGNKVFQPDFSLLRKVLYIS